MRVGTPGFQAKRLTQVRNARGLTQTGLGDIINRTSSNISRWESGVQSPEAKALADLSKALNVPVSFFMNPTLEHGEAPLFFRSMVSTTRSLRKRTRSRLRWVQDVSIALQEWVDLPEINVPRLDVKNCHEITDECIERIALECRKAWELGMGPIGDIILVVENAGIIIVKEEIGTVKMDGLSNWSGADNRAYILVANDKANCVRSRMDVAHELGHLVLHHSIPDTLKNGEDFKEIERQAFHFGGAFLMPAETFGAEIWSPSLDAFLELKERWKVSIAAMIKRCAALGIISEDYQSKIWKYYSSRGWRRSEPLDDKLIPENPCLLSHSIRLLVEENVRSKEQLLNDFRLNATDVEALAGLPRGYMSDQRENVVVKFPKLKFDSQTDTPTD